MPMIWARTIKDHRIERSETHELSDDLTETLNALCVRLDIPRPLWLSKHTREWKQFGQTSFRQEHFVESIAFDRLEIEWIDPNAQKKKSQDPRNG